MKHFKQFLQRWLGIRDLSERVYDLELEVGFNAADLVEVEPSSDPELAEAVGLHFKDSPVVIEPTVIATPKPEVIKGYDQRH